MSTVGKAAEPSHVPVLLHEAVEALALRANGRYIDATYGRGGHSSFLMEQLGGEGRLLALDRDPDAVADAHQRFACLLYTSPSPRDATLSRMPSSA